MEKISLIIAIILSMTGCNISAETATKTEPVTEQAQTFATDDMLRVDYIDVGQGDSILITTPDGVNMLIDAGEGEGKSGAVTSYLTQRGIDEIDTVIATHPHSDHINAMDEVLDSTEVEHFYMPDVSHTTKDFENMLDALEDVEDIKAVKAGDTFSLGQQVSCRVLAPCSESYEDLNDYSVVIKLTYGETDFIFMGDAEALSEEEILAAGEDVSADVLKCGHHGSSSSSSPDFVEAVDPQYAVISCGVDNSYGHPDSETLSVLDSFGITVLRTDKQGTITIESDGNNIIYKDTASAVSEEAVQTTNESEAVFKDSRENETSSPVESEITYIGNINSKKFHKSDCSTLPAEKNRVYFSSRQEALQQGYSPCGKCDP